MNCGKVWNRFTLVRNCSTSFLEKTFKRHRENILFDIERSLMPSTQEQAQHILEARKYIAEMKQNMTQIHMLKGDMIRPERSVDEMRYNNTIRLRIFAIELENRVLEALSTRQQSQTSDETRVRREFIHACPTAGCKGFLSTQWKCGLCNKYTCKECHCTKEGADHVCNPDTVASIQMLKSDKSMKPCPKCGISISKIEGCFAPNTPILMWDGTIKTANSIELGDVLVGMDGKQRRVIHLTSGDAEMYEIQQNNGVTYTVNGKHTLLLKKGSESNIHNILVEDFVKIAPSVQKNYMGFKSEGIFWEHKDVLLDPYLMGVWLGDGINNGTSFASNDNEIIKYIMNWCDANNAELVHDAAYRFRVRGRTHTRKSMGHGSSIETCKGCKEKMCTLCDSVTDECMIETRTNPLKNVLHTYNLIQNKHVPIEYIINDEEVRLRLLAGFIDTDGHVSCGGKRVVIIQTDRVIVDAIAFVSRSLGFHTSITIMKRNRDVVIRGIKVKNCKEIFRINISGKISKIPTLLPRKKCIDDTPNKDKYRTGIQVKSIGTGSYVGWTLDGTDDKFILPDTTVVKNCDQMFCTICNIAFSWRTGELSTGTIHNPHYFEYLRSIGRDTRNLEDIGCGGLPHLGYRTPPEVLIIYERAAEFQRYKLPRYAQFVTQNVNGYTDLRIAYMINDIDEKTFKLKLQQYDKMRQKSTDIAQAMSTYIQIVSDILRRHQTQKTLGNPECLDELKGAMKYINSILSDVSKTYNCVVPVIEPTRINSLKY